jgi:hypothetical protein
MPELNKQVDDAIGQVVAVMEQAQEIAVSAVQTGFSFGTKLVEAGRKAAQDALGVVKSS